MDHTVIHIHVAGGGGGHLVVDGSLQDGQGVPVPDQDSLLTQVRLHLHQLVRLEKGRGSSEGIGV